MRGERERVKGGEGGRVKGGEGGRVKGEKHEGKGQSCKGGVT